MTLVVKSRVPVLGPGICASQHLMVNLLTAVAVRGAGNGDRDIGAARMYMMAELESMA